MKYLLSLCFFLIVWASQLSGHTQPTKGPDHTASSPVPVLINLSICQHEASALLDSPHPAADRKLELAFVENRESRENEEEDDEDLISFKKRLQTIEHLASLADFHFVASILHCSTRQAGSDFNGLDNQGERYLVLQVLRI